MMVEPIRIKQEFPDGDGRPDCEHCHGRGVVPYLMDPMPKFVVGEIMTPCECVRARDVLVNVKRTWVALVKTEPVKKTPLKGKGDTNLWITTANQVILKAHLKRVILDGSSNWYVRVVTDAELMDAWLSRDIPDHEVIDVDVQQVRRANKKVYMSLSDLTDPPDLLIVQLGVKAARNSAMCEVLQETLNTRAHEDKPTWIVDSEISPLNPNHLAYSEQVHDAMGDWEHITLVDPKASSKKDLAGNNPYSAVTMMTISGAANIDLGETHSMLDEALQGHLNHAKVKKDKHFKTMRGEKAV